MQAKLEDPVALTQEIIRGYYQGDSRPWLSRLCAKSVWISTGERVLIGGDAIREHFESTTPWKACRIFQEEYYSLPVNARSAAVAAQVTVGKLNSRTAHITASFTILYQMIGTETKVVLTHDNHGFLRASRPEQGDSVMWVPAYHLYRNLLADMPETSRIPVPSGGRTFYIHPNIILYAQSRNRRAELFCVDAVIRSDLSLSQLNALLPEDFCPIHRCYTVNPRHVSAIRRYKVTMVTGETLPVPAEAYHQVKTQLDRRISGMAAAPEPRERGEG
ncbi:MAG: LytTR family transcriptional regulator [Oscillibacter sp.]|nr:LytTR family transcriptional regulator [Oscillibacter sp.]